MARRTDDTLLRKLWEAGYHAEAVARTASRVWGKPVSAKSVQNKASMLGWQRPAHYDRRMCDPEKEPTPEELAEILESPAPTERAVVPASAPPVRVAVPHPTASTEVEAAAYCLAAWVRERARTGALTVAEARALAAALKDISGAVGGKDSQKDDRGRQAVVQIAIVAPQRQDS